VPGSVGSDDTQEVPGSVGSDDTYVVSHMGPSGSARAFGSDDTHVVATWDHHEVPGTSELTGFLERNAFFLL
jgi:hypothetical protein